MISLREAKNLPEMLILKKFIENNPGHIDQSVYDHSLKTLKAMRSMTKNPFLLLIAFLHDIGKSRTMVVKGKLRTCPDHDSAGAEIIAKLNLGLSGRMHFLAVKLVRNHLIAFNSENVTAELKRKSRGFEKEQVLLAIADLKGGDEYRISRKGYLQRLKLFKEAFREFS